MNYSSLKHTGALNIQVKHESKTIMVDMLYSVKIFSQEIVALYHRATKIPISPFGHVDYCDITVNFVRNTPYIRPSSSHTIGPWHDKMRIVSSETDQRSRLCCIVGNVVWHIIWVGIIMELFFNQQVPEIENVSERV